MMTFADVIFFVGDVALGRSLVLSALVPTTRWWLPSYTPGALCCCQDKIQCLQWWLVSNDFLVPLLDLTDVFWRHCLDVDGYILVELTSASRLSRRTNRVPCWGPWGCIFLLSVSFILVSPVVIIAWCILERGWLKPEIWFPLSKENVSNHIGIVIPLKE